eukprot:Gregarina_sp_Poly_1__2959@NODE_182_length_11803_cov_169_166752_g162_i0_p8_GENE_NODE_182_length_11803_cov_169_166752_g162_i0NODE_182_length_11803_cov_169_166752_g162_i0_p8_ORF_typecomplete_len159_score21_08Flavodoxin_2/PF02525_17/1_7e09_NODE_182_length_11803_cov_169_166752_g162_i079488424
MYNFGPTSYLKSYIDQLVRYGVTFTSSEEARSHQLVRTRSLESSTFTSDTWKPERYNVKRVPYKGLLDSSKIVILIVSSSWCFRKGSALEKMDYLTSWFCSVMNMMGIRNVMVVKIDSLDEVEIGLKSREEKCNEAAKEFSLIVPRVLKDLELGKNKV